MIPSHLNSLQTPITTDLECVLGTSRFLLYMSSQQHPPQRRSERIQNLNSGPPDPVRPPPMPAGPPPQPDQQPVYQSPNNTANNGSILTETIGTPSSLRTQGSETAQNQPSFAMPTFAQANNIAGTSPDPNQQHFTFCDICANYSQSAQPFSPSRFQTIDSEVTTLKKLRSIKCNSP